MGADFCQQEVHVTMVTRQRSDVIALNRSLALWGYFWGIGSASQFFTLSSLLLHIRIKMATINYKWFVYLEVFLEFHLALMDNKR